MTTTTESSCNSYLRTAPEVAIRLAIIFIAAPSTLLCLSLMASAGFSFEGAYLKLLAIGSASASIDGMNQAVVGAIKRAYYLSTLLSAVLYVLTYPPSPWQMRNQILRRLGWIRQGRG